MTLAWAWVLLCSALHPLPAAAAEPGARAPHHFLFLVDTSFSMVDRATSTRRAVRDLVQTGDRGQMASGDVIHLWTFNEEVSTRGFRALAWDALANEALARQALVHLLHTRFEKQTRLDKALEPTWRLAASVERLTVICLSDGDEPVRGTPFDREINAANRVHRREAKRAAEPLITVLQARGGQVVGWSLETAAGRRLDGSALAVETAPAPAPSGVVAGVSQPRVAPAAATIPSTAPPAVASIPQSRDPTPQAKAGVVAAPRSESASPAVSPPPAAAVTSPLAAPVVAPAVPAPGAGAPVVAAPLVPAAVPPPEPPRSQTVSPAPVAADAPPPPGNSPASAAILAEGNASAQAQSGPTAAGVIQTAPAATARVPNPIAVPQAKSEASAEPIAVVPAAVQKLTQAEGLSAPMSAAGAAVPPSGVAANRPAPGEPVPAGGPASAAAASTAKAAGIAPPREPAPQSVPAVAAAAPPGKPESRPAPPAEGKPELRPEAIQAAQAPPAALIIAPAVRNSALPYVLAGCLLLGTASLTIWISARRSSRSKPRPSLISQTMTAPRDHR